MKGGPSKGKHGRARVHRACPRCGRISLHIAKKVCAACGYGKSRKIRNYSFLAKKTTTRQRKKSK